MVKRIINTRDEKKGLDFYATPEWATEAFLKCAKDEFLHPSWIVESTGEGAARYMPVWEPACGDGAMSRVLTQHFPLVVSSDIEKRWPDDDALCCFQADFLDELLFEIPRPLHGKHFAIITNPPFSEARRFLIKARELTPFVAILARLSWLEGRERYDEIFRKDPPSTVYVYCRRIGFLKNGDDKYLNGAGVAAHAWFVWGDRADVGETVIKWIE